MHPKTLQYCKYIKSSLIISRQFLNDLPTLDILNEDLIEEIVLLDVIGICQIGKDFYLIIQLPDDMLKYRVPPLKSTHSFFERRNVLKNKNHFIKNFKQIQIF